MTSFDDLGLRKELLRAVSEGGYRQPTPIQAKAIPVVLTGADIMASAQTGTGKTAGFTLPLLNNLSQKRAATTSGKPKVRALILTPTRELAAQISQSVEQYGKYLPLKSAVIFGGVSINPQITQLRKGVDILIATPGRLLDHASQGTVDLSAVEILVLDEADRMLDMGFIHDVRRVLKLLPDKSARQSLLFSATFSKPIRQLASSMLSDPQSVDVAPANATADRIAQRVYLVAQKQKRSLLSHLLDREQWQQVLVFTRTKHRANRLAEQLERDGHTAAAIHGNKSQGARTRALANFKSGEITVLVATDIAARGLDIDQLPYVVNYELPQVAEDYVHRIGRTARAGKSGEAISLVSGDERKLLTGIERLIGQPIDRSIADGFEPVESSDEPEEKAAPPRNSGRRKRKPASNTSANNRQTRPVNESRPSTRRRSGRSRAGTAR